MTKEEQLLLVDLCAALPYGVKFQLTDDDGFVYNTTLTGIDLDTGIFYGADIDGSFGRCHIENIKPYLRPMSSMTEEERNDFSLSVSPKGSAIYYNDFIRIPLSHLAQQIPYEYIARIIDWLNAHHFDYRGLIEKGLAISTETFNPYKD